MLDDDINRRLSALEKQLRFWKGIILISVVVLLVLGVAAFTPQGTTLGRQDRGVLQVPLDRALANEFVLMGEDGNVYARLTLRRGNPVLNFYDENGRVIWSAPPKVSTKPAAN
jgi:hypothetical protein